MLRVLSVLRLLHRMRCLLLWRGRGHLLYIDIHGITVQFTFLCLWFIGRSVLQFAFGSAIGIRFNFQLQISKRIPILLWILKSGRRCIDILIRERPQRGQQCIVFNVWSVIAVAVLNDDGVSAHTLALMMVFRARL